MAGLEDRTVVVVAMMDFYLVVVVVVAQLKRVTGKGLINPQR